MKPSKRSSTPSQALPPQTVMTARCQSEKKDTKEVPFVPARPLRRRCRHTESWRSPSPVQPEFEREASGASSKGASRIEAHLKPLPPRGTSPGTPNHPWSLAKRGVLARGWSWSCGKPDRFVRDVQEATRPHVGSTDGRPATRQNRSWLPLHQRRLRRIQTMDGADKEDKRRSGKLKALGPSLHMHGHA